MAMELFSVLITGANRGIGLEFTRQLVNSNKPPKHIFVTYRDEATIQELKALQNSASSGTNVHLLKMDVLDTDAVKEGYKVIEDVVGEQGLTLLINNAGVGRWVAFSDLKAEDLLFHFNTNTVGPILMAQVMLPLLKKSASRTQNPGMSFSRAGILNLSTEAGSIANAGITYLVDIGVPSYKISKAALNMAMRILAHTVKDDNILVVNLCPGWLKTDMGGDMAELTPQEGISTVLETISKLDEAHHGTYLTRFGEVYPW